MKYQDITLSCQQRHPEDIAFLEDWDNERFYYLSNSGGNYRRLSLEESLTVWNKSPSGFYHGYGGSGPAQLSLAICLRLYGKAVALQVFQDFKWKYIAPLPKEDDNFFVSLSVPIMESANEYTGHPFRVGDLVTVDRRFATNEQTGYVYDEYISTDGYRGVSVLLEDGTDLGGFSYDEQQRYLAFVKHITPVYQYANNVKLYRDIREGLLARLFQLEIR